MVKKKREGTPQIALSVGKAIARQRKAVGKTQKKVAEEMETGIETISRLESGAILQTVDRLQQLSVVLHCPITSFFWECTGKDDIRAATISDMLRILPENKREAVVKMVGEIVRVMQE